MKNKIAILLNWNTQGKIFWLKPELEKLGYNVDQFNLENFNVKDVSQSSRKPLLFIKYLILVISTLRKKEYSIIISPNFHIGAITSILAYLFNYKVKIIGFNLIVDKKPFIIKLIREHILKYSFKNKNFYFTLNGLELIVKYEKILQFKLPKMNIIELYDCYSYEMYNEQNSNQNYVFSGGITGRDWDTFFKAAEMLPNIKFKCIIQKEKISRNFNLKNVELSSDFSRENYRIHISNCTLIAIPLLSESPSGLLTIFEGALNEKAIIITESKVVQKFVNNDAGVLIKRFDYKELAVKIQNLMTDVELRTNLAKNMKLNLEKHHSPSARALQLKYIIDNFNH